MGRLSDFQLTPPKQANHQHPGKRDDMIKDCTRAGSIALARDFPLSLRINW